ncbi:hypothetical protein K2173_015184 [Erythroxylum novogranatense]|uniref:Uncharacterized protein n=1 Tax=Erythroxylum novogranatense TaxID=1862640 RepID=A0AAV8T1G8_9ROSI|nr:hypothetical protein K2173_015184 [Erythroxylum novogranatense]
MDFEYESGSKHSDSQLEFIDGNESITHFLPYPRLHVRVASNDSDHLKLHFRVPSNDSDDLKVHIRAATNDSNHLTIHPEVIDGSNNSVHYDSGPDLFDGFNSSKLSSPDYISDKDSAVMPVTKLGSHSSLASSLDDLFPMNAIEDFGPIYSITISDKAREDISTALKNDENDTSSSNSSNPEEDGIGSPGFSTTSSVSDITHESLERGLAPTQCPHIQVMERPKAFDPFRIPSDIFDKPLTPLEWSIASDESLFSIQANSLARDHALAMSNLAKSGELPSSNYLVTLSPPPPLAVLRVENQSPSTQAKINEQANKTDELNEKLENIAETGSMDETVKDETKETTKVQSLQTEQKKQAPAVSWKSTATSNLSSESGKSTSSFSFPTRNKSSWPSCYCSNCGRPLRYYTWLKCTFRCSRSLCSTSNCSWSCCYSWNSNRKRWHSPSPNNFSGGTRTRNQKPNIEEFQSQQSESTAIEKLTSHCWFRHYSCWSWCSIPRCGCC